MTLKSKKLQIIGLAGLAGHGKTEVADMLVELTGYKRMAFATAVKRTASAMFNVRLEYFYEGSHGIDRNKTVIARHDMTIREMMRIVGDAMKVAQTPDWWIKLLEKDLISQGQTERGFIIEDLRYDDTNNPWKEECDEAGAVRSWGGTIMHVDALERVGRNEVHMTHHSENGIKRLDDDIVIDNNSDLKHLKTQIENICDVHGWYKL